MSKSYSNYKTIGVCYGNNTPYYKARRRKFRSKNNQSIRNLLAHSSIEDFDINYKPFHQPTKDSWDEPTDGSYKVTYNGKYGGPTFKYSPIIYNGVYFINGKVKK